jgi:hypothetical protein
MDRKYFASHSRNTHANILDALNTERMRKVSLLHENDFDNSVGGRNSNYSLTKTPPLILSAKLSKNK